LLDPETDFATGAVHTNAQGHDKTEAALLPLIIELPEITAGLFQWVSILCVDLIASRR
jgi:hypothetical protein